MSCKKVYSLKYDYRSGPPYKANNCKNTRKKGNDQLMYVSKKDKNGVYRWKKINKTLKKKNTSLTMKDLQQMAKQYHITKSGSKKQLAKRILLLREHLISKTNKKLLNDFLSS
tara:strand:+ start:116 stop:454 length:339 start_codon:yes stop_codon:yes gene_type:complete